RRATARGRPRQAARVSRLEPSERGRPRRRVPEGRAGAARAPRADGRRGLLGGVSRVHALPRRADGEVRRPAAILRSVERARPARVLRGVGESAMRARVLLTLAIAALAGARGQALRAEILRSIGGLPPHIAGGFNEAVG